MHRARWRPIRAEAPLLSTCLLSACLLASGLLIGPVSAQPAGEGLSPTLANIKATHAVRIGYRESSPPFSFLDHSNRPISCY